MRSRLRSHLWYEQHSYCWEGDETRHVGCPVVSLAGELVGHICGTCFDPVIRASRGGPLWVRLADCDATA